MVWSCDEKGRTGQSEINYCNRFRSDGTENSKKAQKTMEQGRAEDLTWKRIKLKSAQDKEWREIITCPNQ